MPYFSLKRRKEPQKLDRVLSLDKLEDVIELQEREGTSSPRCRRAISAFLASEGWAKQDWLRVYEMLSETERQNLDPDFIVRTVRSSGFMAQPERRARRNLDMCRQRSKWEKKHGLKELMAMCNGGFSSGVHEKLILSDRVEQFRNQVFPLKMFGFSKAGVPLVKFSFSESNWKSATQEFKDKDELKLFIILTLQCLQEMLQQARCRAESADDSVNVTGKFLLICDISGCRLADIKLLHRLQLFKTLRYVNRFFPDLVLKMYVLHQKCDIAKCGRKLLWPFFPSHIIKRIIFFSRECDIVERLVHEDNYEIGQIPVEYGGNFEGRYIVSIERD